MTFFSLLLFSSWARAIFHLFRRLGPVGLFLLGIGDSSFLFLPFGNDLLLIVLVSQHRASWQWLFYPPLAALGSLVGVLLVDSLMRKAGEEGLARMVGPAKLAGLKAKMEKRGAWAVFFACLLPPPFPFTAVVAAAAALQTARRGILWAALLGRLLRFSLEAVLAFYFGRRLLRYLQADEVEYFMYAFIALVLVGSILTIRQWLRARPHRGATPTETVREVS